MLVKTTGCQRATGKAWSNISSLLGIGLQSSRTHSGQAQNLQLRNEPRTANLPGVPLKMLKKIVLKQSMESYWLGASSGSSGVSHRNESLEDGSRFELPGVRAPALLEIRDPCLLTEGQQKPGEHHAPLEGFEAGVSLNYDF